MTPTKAVLLSAALSGGAIWIVFILANWFATRIEAKNRDGMP